MGIWVQGLEEEEWEAFFAAYGKESLTGRERQRLLDSIREVEGHPLSMERMVQGLELGPETQRDFLLRIRLKREEQQVLRELSILPAIPQALYRSISKTSDEAVERLVSCMLVRGEGTGEDRVLSLHPVIAEAARRVFSPSLSNCRRMLHGFYELTREALGGCGPERERLEPYVSAFLEAFPELEPWLAREFDALSRWLWIQSLEGDSPKGGRGEEENG